ncbi:MAG: carbohydrate ABC transporter permease [Mycobacteriales bacterium]
MSAATTATKVRAPRPTAPSRRPWYRKAGAKKRIITTIVLIPICLIWIYPFLWMLSASVKPNGKVFAGLGLIPTKWYFDNYTAAWTDAHMGRYFINTITITVAAVAIVLITTSTMGYVLGRFSFPGKRIVIGILAALVFLPQGYTIIPIFDLVTKLHLTGNLFGIILAESGAAHIIQVLLFAGYFRQLPNELEESAKVDGAGFLRTFLQIFLPLSRPVIATTIILQVIASWNDFLIPLVLTSSQPNLRTLAVGIYSFQGNNFTQYSHMAAASAISLLPVIIIFLVLQRHFIEGLAGAVKQ